MAKPPGGVVAKPTYMADIRHYFEQIDIDHMAAKSIDLGTYAGVKKNALAVYAHTTQPGGDMPPEADRKWSADQSQTFRNWIVNGYPQGTAVVRPGPVRGGGGGRAAARVRKDVTSLSKPEVDTLIKAFEGVMAKPPGDAQSYYAQASIHGLPQSYCLHHEDRFNPWHRVYLKQFEDALRAVPGCNDVTLPYWNLSDPVPALLKQAPFATYTVPEDLGPGYGTNYKTTRYGQATIDANLAQYGVLQDIDTALQQSLWGVSGVSGLQDYFIAAHDGGHVSIGQTMADQNVSSYDPIFWFYHCNLDRIWVDWQIKVGATTLATFMSTLAGDTGWLSAPFNALPPFATTADQTIAYGITYDPPKVSRLVGPLENKLANIDAVRAFTIAPQPKVSVMVKAIDRLNIPGSFVVSLLADGQPVAKRAFFQPISPRDCENCRKHGLVNVSFRVGSEAILGKKLTVAIDVPGHEAIGTSFPLAQAGNPSVNARLLLEDT